MGGTTLSISLDRGSTCLEQITYVGIPFCVGAFCSTDDHQIFGGLVGAEVFPSTDGECSVTATVNYVDEEDNSSDGPDIPDECLYDTSNLLFGFAYENLDQVVDFETGEYSGDVDALADFIEDCEVEGGRAVQWSMEAVDDACEEIPYKSVPGCVPTTCVDEDAELAIAFALALSEGENAACANTIVTIEGAWTEGGGSTKASKAPKAGKGSKAPKAPKAGKGSKAPKSPKEPKAGKGSKAPKAPKEPKAGKGSKAPKAPKEPKAGKGSKAPKAPKEPKAGKA